MHCYLIQHGDAVEKDVDPERPLSEAGAADTGAIAKFLSGLEIGVHEIWHSGKLRAKQTAQILAPALGADAELIEHEGLAPNDSAQDTAKELRRAKYDVAVAGHLPHLTRLAGLLLTDDEERDPVAFQKGGIVCLCREEGVWRVCWMLVPALVRRQEPAPD